MLNVQVQPHFIPKPLFSRTLILKTNLRLLLTYNFGRGSHYFTLWSRGRASPLMPAHFDAFLADHF